MQKCKLLTVLAPVIQSMLMANDKVKVEVKGKSLIITLPIEEKDSKSGKSITIATTNGNKGCGIEYKGKEIQLGVNAYIAK